MLDSSISTAEGDANRKTQTINVPVKDDVQYLLYLETLKRFKDDEQNISKQIEDKNRQFQELRSEYLNLYTKYVNLKKLISTRIALESHKCLDASQVLKAKENISLIKKTISNRNLVEFVDKNLLEKFRQNLSVCESHEKLNDLHKDFMEMKTNVKTIQLAIETVENTVETAIIQGLDYFVDEFQIENQ